MGKWFALQDRVIITAFLGVALHFHLGTALGQEREEGGTLPAALVTLNDLLDTLEIRAIAHLEYDRINKDPRGSGLRALTIFRKL